MKLVTGTRYDPGDGFEYEILGPPENGNFPVQWKKFSGKVTEGVQPATILYRNLKSGRWKLTHDKRCSVCLERKTLCKNK